MISPNTRKLLRQIHLWSALTVGLVLVGTALSGLFLVWRPQLDPQLNPHLQIVQAGSSRLEPDDLVARARAAYPGRAVESIRWFGEPTAPFLVYFSDKRYVHLNPYTGEVLGIRERYGDLFGWFEGWHKFLQIDPDLGETITGTVALIFVGIIATGLVVWWPANRRAWRASLTVNRRLKGRAWHLNLHRTFAGYAAIILLVSASTGVPIALNWAKNALYPLTASAKELPPLAATDSSQAFAGFSAAASELQRQWPGARESYVPAPKRGVVAAYAIEAGAPHAYARSYAYLSSVDAAVLRATPYASASRGMRLYYWMMSLHTGLLGGWPVQLLLFLGTACVLLLAWTGTASFLKRKFGRASGAGMAAKAA